MGFISYGLEDTSRWNRKQTAIVKGDLIYSEERYYLELD
jgi:hypothetical protein